MQCTSFVRAMYVRCTQKLKGLRMAKTVNLTVRISPELKEKAEAAADFLDLSISQIVRDAFRATIERAETQMLRQASFASRFAEYGVDAPPATRKQEEEMKAHGIDTRSLSKQQREALKRGQRAGKFVPPKVKPSMKDDVIASIRKRAEDGLISQQEADEKIWRLENPEHV